VTMTADDGIPVTGAMSGDRGTYGSETFSDSEPTATP